MPYQGFKMLRTTSLFRFPVKPLVLPENAGGERNEEHHEHVGLSLTGFPTPFPIWLSATKHPPAYLDHVSIQHGLTDLHCG